MKRLVTIFAAILLLGGGCTQQLNQKTTEAPKQDSAQFGFTKTEWDAPVTSDSLIGTWMNEPSTFSSTITFNIDGSVEEIFYPNKNMSDSPITHYFGTWNFDGSRLSINWKAGGKTTYVDLHRNSTTLALSEENSIGSKWAWQLQQAPTESNKK